MPTGAPELGKLRYRYGTGTVHRVRASMPVVHMRLRQYAHVRVWLPWCVHDVCVVSAACARGVCAWCVYLVNDFACCGCVCNSALMVYIRVFAELPRS